MLRGTLGLFALALTIHMALVVFVVLLLLCGPPVGTEWFPPCRDGSACSRTWGLLRFALCCLVRWFAIGLERHLALRHCASPCCLREMQVQCGSGARRVNSEGGEALRAGMSAIEFPLALALVAMGFVAWIWRGRSRVRCRKEWPGDPPPAGGGGDKASMGRQADLSWLSCQADLNWLARITIMARTTSSSPGCTCSPHAHGDPRGQAGPAQE